MPRFAFTMKRATRSNVCCAPSAFSLITIPVPQQKRLEPMTTPAPIVHRIAAGAAQIADRFIGGLGNVNGSQFPRPQQSRQFTRIALVGLEPIACPGGRE